MPIKNYTSGVSPYTSLGEIQGALAQNGASKIMVDYEHGEPVAVTFAMETMHGLQGFTIPAPMEGTLRAFQKQNVKVDKEQAKRTAWRNVRDWIMAQVALVESCDVPMDQVFLPFLTDRSGKTIYEIYAKGQLLLAGDVNDIDSIKDSEG